MSRREVTPLPPPLGESWVRTEVPHFGPPEGSTGEGKLGSDILQGWGTGTGTRTPVPGSKSDQERTRGPVEGPEVRRRSCEKDLTFRPVRGGTEPWECRRGDGNMFLVRGVTS